MKAAVNTMGLNNAKRTEMTERRTQVAALRLRGNTQREIADKLRISLGTVNADIKAIECEWRQQATADTQAYKGRVLAELAEVKRAAWAATDFRVVLQALKAECDLLGLDAPLKIEGAVEVTHTDARDKLAQQLDRLARPIGQGEVAGLLN